MGRVRESIYLVLILLLLFLLLLLFQFQTAEGKRSFLRECRQKPAPLFIFGDSFFDPGNNNYINTSTLDQANFNPYGETYFNFPTGRFSDGRLISDFIAEYAKLPLIPPFLQPGNQLYYSGINFASAGAGALVETFQGAVIGMKTQVSYFMNIKAKNAAELRNKISSAVYLISIGSNDYMPFS